MNEKNTLVFRELLSTPKYFSMAILEIFKGFKASKLYSICVHGYKCTYIITILYCNVVLYVS